MIAEGVLGYLGATFLAFLVNVIPAFAPPTWIVLSLYKINNPQLNSLALAFFGVIGSVAGRFVMYLYSRALGGYIPQKYADNLNYFRKFIGEKKLGIFLGTLIYSLGPFPSCFLFIAFGVSSAEVLPVLIFVEPLHGNYLHMVALMKNQKNEVIARIKLFAQYGAPEYLVVVGRLNE